MVIAQSWRPPLEDGRRLLCEVRRPARIMANRVRTSDGESPLPEDESARLAALHDAQVLDTAPEEDFDDIALLTSEICGTPTGLLRLIDDLLMVARLTDEGVQLDLTEVDLAEVAHQVTSACRPLADHKQVKLRDRTQSPVPARGDVKRLSQAFNHLVASTPRRTPRCARTPPTRRTRRPGR